MKEGRQEGRKEKMERGRTKTKKKQEGLSNKREVANAAAGNCTQDTSTTSTAHTKNFHFKCPT